MNKQQTTINEQRTTNNEGIVVLGAGLAGLGFARTLPGCKLYEAKAYPGGHAHSHEFHGIHFDRGAHICHADDALWLNLLHEQAGKVNQITGSSVLNYKQAHWFSYPVQNHLYELPECDRIIALQDFVKAQVKYRDKVPANYLEWCLFQYGEFLTNEFYKLYTDKYWHTPMEELAVDWLGGRLLPSQVDNIVAGAVQNQDEKQAVFRTFRYPAKGGFYSFFKPLYEDANVTCNAKAVTIDPVRKVVDFENGTSIEYRYLVSSIPLSELVYIMKDVPREIREATSQLKHLQQVCVNLLASTDLVDAHWFYIYDAPIAASRVSLPNRLAGTSYDGKTALQIEIFEHSDSSVDEEELRDDAVRDLCQVLKIGKEDVLAIESRYYSHSYVISDHKRAHAVASIAGWLEKMKIYTMGLSGRWEYMWSNKAYASGVATAHRLISN